VGGGGNLDAERAGMIAAMASAAVELSHQRPQLGRGLAFVLAK
jgi:hypothetical protein